MKVAVYQGIFPVNAIMANCERMIRVAHEAVAQKVDLLIFPECALSGYLPEDLLMQADFNRAVQEAQVFLALQFPANIWIILGTPYYQDHKIFNALLVYHDHKIDTVYIKQALPNYGVFDEERYFVKGHEPGTLTIRGLKLGLLICEDFWRGQVFAKLGNDLDMVISINASPFDITKREQRLVSAQAVVQKLKVPFVYVHQVGVQDEVIFDGASFILGKDATLLGVLPQFKEVFATFEVASATKITLDQEWQPHFALDKTAELYQSLIYALRAYVRHHRFPGVLIGLSGGIDSALTLALAVAALGADQVEGVLMPSRFTEDLSIAAAKKQAATLGVKIHEISIEPLFKTFLQELSPHFVHKNWDVTEENIQARLRGMILMALSNKSGKIVLATVNKSELAVGYGTLYGDLIGGFALLKDLYKTDVYRLARFCNQTREIIPEEVIQRAPTAELRANQKDQDSLPDYDLLDKILKLYVEENLSLEHICAQGFAEIEVERVIQMIHRSEHKRHQAPLGPKVSRRGFGKDWRMPIMKNKH
jgi:NAD+ synthetase